VLSASNNSLPKLSILHLYRNDKSVVCLSKKIRLQCFDAVGWAAGRASVL